MCLLMSIHGPGSYSLITGEIGSRSYFLASGFDHPEWPVVTSDNPSAVTLSTWGLVPHWMENEAKARSIRNQTLNARVETLFVKPAFRDAARKGRCLVLVDGFYEPHRHNGVSYPFFCSMAGGGLFAIAGVLSHWRNPANDEIWKSFTIVTIPANRLMARIHNEKKRMPAILDSDAVAREWLRADLTPEEAGALLETHELPGLGAHPVTRKIYARGVDMNVPEAREPVVYPELAEEG